MISFYLGFFLCFENSAKNVTKNAEQVTKCTCKIIKIPIYFSYRIRENIKIMKGNGRKI